MLLDKQRGRADQGCQQDDDPGHDRVGLDDQLDLVARSAAPQGAVGAERIDGAPFRGLRPLCERNPVAAVKRFRDSFRFVRFGLFPCKAGRLFSRFAVACRRARTRQRGSPACAPVPASGVPATRFRMSCTVKNC